MGFKPLNILLLVVLLALPASANAGWFDFLTGGSGEAEKKNNAFNDEQSECGKQIEIYKHFLHDGKICKRDMDCIAMDGICPLGCKIYVIKSFEGIMAEEMQKVADKCENPVCASKCPIINVTPICKDNKCQARAK